MLNYNSPTYLNPQYSLIAQFTDIFYIKLIILLTLMNSTQNFAKI